jgi:hypothetical protein
MMPLVHNDTAEQMNAEYQFDEASFLAKIPYKLTPTDLKGVYAHVGPPDDFDPNTATQRGLIQHGILVRKPTANDPEQVLQAWTGSSLESGWPRIESNPSLKCTLAGFTI